MTSIAYRQDRAARIVIAGLESNLDNDIAAVNADLVSEGVSWSLPTFSAEEIHQELQAEHHPRDERSIRVVLGTAALSAASIGNGARSVFPLTVVATVSTDDLNVSGATELSQAGQALGMAIFWCVGRALFEWEAAAEILNATITTTMHNFEEFADGVESTAFQVNVTANVAHMALLRRE